MSKRQFVTFLVIANLVVLLLVTVVSAVSWYFITNSSARSINQESVLGASVQANDSLVLGIRDNAEKVVFVQQENTTVRIYEVPTPTSPRQLFTFELMNLGLPLKSQIQSEDLKNYYYLEESIGGSSINLYELPATRSEIYTSDLSITSLITNSGVVYFTQILPAGDQERELLTLARFDRSGYTELNRFFVQNPQQYYLDQFIGSDIQLRSVASADCLVYLVSSKEILPNGCKDEYRDDLEQKYTLKKSVTAGSVPESLPVSSPLTKINFQYEVYLTAEYELYETSKSSGTSPEPLYVGSPNQDLELIAATVDKLVLIAADTQTRSKQLVSLNPRLRNQAGSLLNLPLVDSVESLGVDSNETNIYLKLEDTSSRVYNSVYFYSFSKDQLQQILLPTCRLDSSICDYYLITNIRFLD